MKIAILGAGSIGSLIAAKLAQVDENQLLIHARGDHGSRMAIDGISIQGEESFHINGERMIVSLEEVGLYQGLNNKVDVLFITCKAYDVEKLIKSSINLVHADSKVICLSNGLGHVEKCIEHFGQHRVFAASITHGAWRPEPGIIEWAGKGMISIGRFGNGPGKDDAEPLLDVLEKAGLNPSWNDDGYLLIWSKVLLNIAINPMAALIGCENGVLITPDLLEICSEVMFEGANIAKQERVELPSDIELQSRLEKVLQATSKNFCSMLQDVKNGRQTEIEFLNQVIVERAERYGISTPRNNMLTELIKAINSN
jgi:2-dehydropantoate 2-reductase